VLEALNSTEAAAALSRPACGGVRRLFFATGLRGTVMPTVMFTFGYDWVAGNNQRELEAPLERWPRSSETGLPEATPTAARCRASSPSPSPRHHRGVIASRHHRRVIASRAIGANGCRPAGSRTGVDRDCAAVGRIMDDDLGRDGVSRVGARLTPSPPAGMYQAAPRRRLPRVAAQA